MGMTILLLAFVMAFPAGALAVLLLANPEPKTPPHDRSKRQRGG
jgi:hypothetical protein